MQKDERLFELEELLNEAKEKYKAQIFLRCRSFPKYLVDNYGHVKSPAKVIQRKCPRDQNKLYNYFIKEKILHHLHTGVDQRWTTVILIKDDNYSKHQVSVAKLIASTFLNIEIKDLPRQIYFIDGNPKNLTLFNLSFFRSR